MTTYKVVAELDSSNRAQRLAGFMAELLEPPPSGLTVFEDGKGWRLEAYYDERPDPIELTQSIDAALPGEAITLSLAEVPDENWVELSQAGLPPVFAGRFTVHGSHDSHRVPRGPLSILIDAGEAFGTAHHATTYGCLLAIDEVTRPWQRACRMRRVLDLGCGSGVLAIALARALPGAEILATDIDTDSVRVARQNAAINSCLTRIEVAEMSGPPATGYGFDLVVANILAGPLTAMAPLISRAVSPGGHLILSGILVPQAAAVQARYCAFGFEVRGHQRLAGWSTFTLRRRY